MQKRDGIDYKQLRKQVALLYEKVINNELSVQSALVNFPVDCEDKTIITAWHALCHLEADEDIRKKDTLYKQVQDDYIRYIKDTLEKGSELPQNVINKYIPYHEKALIPNSNKLKGIFQKLKQFINC